MVDDPGSMAKTETRVGGHVEDQEAREHYDEDCRRVDRAYRQHAVFAGWGRCGGDTDTQERAGMGSTGREEREVLVNWFRSPFFTCRGLNLIS